MSELTECHGPWPTSTRPHLLLASENPTSLRTYETKVRRSWGVVTPQPLPLAYAPLLLWAAPLEAAAPLGFVLYLDLLAPYVLLDDLDVLHNVLADAHLFLEDRALVHNDLFLGYRHHDLILADLGLCGLTLYGHPFDAYLFVAGGDLYALVVCSHALSDPYGAILAFAGSDPKL